MNWKDIKKIIKEELTEATTISAGGSKFNLRTGVNKNPTKLGIKIQFEPKSGALNPDIKAKLEVALQEKLNKGLSKYKIQVSKDTDVPREEVIGFFVPLSQLKALIIEGLGQGDAVEPDSPLAPEPTSSEEEEIDEMIQGEMINEMKIRELNDASDIIKKEDFYAFINAGNNIIRDMEEDKKTPKTKAQAKNYLKYLVKHNIM